ncbi:MFS transporter [Rhodococcus maanshanensis]|uniref:Drug resistance transporter, EmrB/QacA subfamily n=1 Tax=Rhodococcus maanshanensis TaxID=183556 RepID=A0A1H7T8C6_9NOCA|nr:MFS transporter [Rhodococcus maanshanensis]SEL80948.1 drug resistance transporter, EmrB/QacA subfamily [Rhodococcus maanshanensis]
MNRPTESARTKMSAREVWTLTVVCSAVAMVIAAAAGLNSALPALALDTGATQSELTWIVDGYTLTLAALLLPAGALGDRYGRRGVLLVGLLIFAAASALPIWLDSPQWLIGSRAIAGIGAALVMPATLSLLTASFPPEQRSRGVAIWAGVAASGGIAGLLVSGLLLEKWQWQSIFVGFAAAAVALFAIAWTVPSSREEDSPPFDLLGAVLAVAAVGLVVLGLLEGPARGWLDPVVLLAVVGGLLAAVAFAIVEMRRAHPLLDVRLFGVRGFGAGAASLTLQFLASFGLFFLVIQYMQLVLGYSPLQAGIALAPMVVPMVAVSAITPWLIPRVGQRALALCGLALAGVGLILLGGLDIDGGYGQAVVALLMFSAGLGLCSAPATTSIMENTPDDKQGVASAVNDTAREIGAAIGIAVAGSLLAATYTREIAPAVAAVPEVAKEPVGASLASALEVAKRAGPQGEQLADFARDAFMAGMSHSSYVLAAVMLVSAVLVGVWAPGRVRTAGTDAEAAPTELVAAAEPE